MLSLDQIDKSDRVVIEREILVRRKLIGEMVGTLYPSILLGEIAVLREYLDKHLRKEDGQNINISS